MYTIIMIIFFYHKVVEKENSSPMYHWYMHPSTLGIRMHPIIEFFM